MNSLKIAACFIYVLCTIVYVTYATKTLLWFGFGQCTVLGFICVLGLFCISNKPVSKLEKLFLGYCIGMTFGRFVYTFYCVHMEDALVIYNTDVFNFIVYITFFILLGHCAVYRKNYLNDDRD